MMKLARITASVAALGLLVACGSQAAAPPPESESRTTIDVAIADGDITPTGGRVEVEAGEPVTLRVDSDAVDEIHVHSDPEHEFAVVPGDDQSFTFTVDVPGQVAVESHGLDRTIVQLLVR